MWMGLSAAHLLMSYTKKKAVCGWAYRLHIFQCRTLRRKRCVDGLTGCTSFNVVHQEESCVWMGLPAAHLLMSYTKKKAVCGWAYRLHIFQCRKCGWAYRLHRRKRCVDGFTGCTSFNVVHQEESCVWLGLPAAHLSMSYTKKKAVCGWAYRLHIF